VAEETATVRQDGEPGLSWNTSVATTDVTAPRAPGDRRRGGEREVPPEIWGTASFQRWYRAQRNAGNTLEGARLVWTSRVGPGPGAIFFWALHVRMRIAAENRIKDNEIVVSRPDVSAVALYRRGPSLDETTVVLVREFRSPASTPDGNVHELPGGSGAEAIGPLAQAADEVAEEIGMAIDADRLRAHGSRQVASTISAHHAHLFSAEITQGELDMLRSMQGRPFGVDRDSERTWIEIATYREIREARLVDWATLGMLAEALS
jgi:ADP-ribose pyrophosphatase YjhB (NUDIX family)